MRRVHKNLCPAKISASIMAANMWENSLKNVESDNNNILYEILFDFFRRNGTYFLNKPRIFMIISLSKLPAIRNVWKECCREKSTYFIFNNFPKIVIYLYQVEKTSRVGQGTDDNRGYAYCMLDNYGDRHILRICGTYCFSTATVATR